jgi:hypothetical protein
MNFPTVTYFEKDVVGCEGRVAADTSFPECDVALGRMNIPRFGESALVFMIMQSKNNDSVWTA